MKKILLLTLLLAGMSGCQKFSDLEKNPNLPTQVPANLVLKSVLNDLYEGTWNKDSRYNQYYTVNYNYYGNNAYDWTSSSYKYTTLKNVLKMEEEAKKTLGTDKNGYAALGKFFRAYFWVWMTMRVGDVAMTDALKGMDNITPKYNTQKEVFVQSLQWLDEANADLADLIAAGHTTLPFQGDMYLNNSLVSWQKVVNSFKLRVLINLSKRTDDADLKVKARFAEVLGNPAKYPILTGAGDNLQYVYNAVYNKYPVNPDNLGNDATRQEMSATHVDLLKKLQDPRIFVTCEPAEAELKKGAKPTDFAAFAAPSPGLSLDEMSSSANNGAYSFINRTRYYKNYTPEATVILGYAEQCFNIAEAINLGWIAGDAADYYQKGIQTNFDFFGIKNGANTFTFEIRDNGKASFQSFNVNVDLTAYLAQPSVKYAGNTAEGRQQILTQKYLALFMTTGLEPLFNWRRTGFPTNFATTGAGLGSYAGGVPRRWQYPVSDRVYNEKNYKAALKSQFGSETRDDVTDELWLLK
ncbi:SusD/RagB family nutrient-binding outer membrane lipoprotein [Siphonobacter aquaeclarae]|uniref:Starch-binding associating with outer membrane n=1 Tax=Siphonobacter aquaeclarae TaxID=563176 RepID=A0A1G9UCS9_9BACT|nr:SusD/RagB family nutrient-binding outer membrane lipoprotein [Siphonobacter aquaeclarae]SDM57643.1 Starch-binding associating with outer membrane [Siphonobacter aquaeclarae]